jgi:peptide/nickel transport system permease protein
LYWTMLLSFLSIVITYLISIPIGVFSARKKGSKADNIISTFLFMLYSLPNFWIATLLIVFVGTELGWFPIFGVGEVAVDAGFWETLRVRSYHLFLPLLCWTYPSLAFLSRQMRGGMLTVLRQDFIRTARAKGLEEKKVIWKHAFRNSLLPIITLFAGVFPRMISGSIVIEVIFSIPGMGSTMLSAIDAKDFPLVFTIVMFSAILTIIGYLIADILYAIVDPRITYK